MKKIKRKGTFEIDFENKKIKFLEIEGEFEDLSTKSDEYFVEFEIGDIVEYA